MMSTFSGNPMASLRSSETLLQFSQWWFTRRSGTPPGLAYASAMPTRRTRNGQWFQHNVAKAPFRLDRQAIVLKGSEFVELAQHLGEDSTLAEASRLMGLGAPKLCADARMMGSNWTELPAAFFPTGSVAFQSRRGAGGRVSPSNDAACYCTRFAPYERFNFMGAPSFEMLDWLGARLAEETGLRFNGEAADAYGSVEVYQFPALDDQGRSLVSLSYDRAKNSFLVQLHKEAPADALVGVAARNLEDIATHVIGRVDSSQTFTARMSEPVDGATVTIWASTDEGMRIWHCGDVSLIREIRTTFDIEGLTGELSSNWLQDLRSTKADARARALSRFRQSAMETTTVLSNREKEETAISQARELVTRLFPEPSGAHFFAKGWEGESKISFAEWLKKTLSQTATRTILLDPYFDVAGIELVARASGAAKRLTVVTCTQVTSDDDDDHSDRRETRLVSAVQELIPILRGLNFELVDLQSKGTKSRKQLFHDRYIISVGSKGEPQWGFSLSTSLQSATRTSPILVTPIPKDALFDVSDYVLDLLSPETDRFDVITLFPKAPRSTRGSLSDRQARSTLRAIEVIKSRPGLLEFSAVNRLAELGFINSSTDRNVNVPVDDRELELAGAWLTKEQDLSRRAEVWEGLVQMAIADWRGPELPAIVDRLAKIDGTAHFLQAYVVAHGDGSLVADDAETHTRTLAHVLEAEPSEALTQAFLFIEHHHELPLATNWALHLAIRVIVVRFPQLVDETIANLQAHGARSLGPLSEFVSTLTSSVREQPSAFHGLQESGYAFLRFLVGAAYWGLSCAAGWSNVAAVAKHLPPEEQWMLLAQLVHDLRVRANRRANRHAVAHDALQDDASEDEDAFAGVVEQLNRSLAENGSSSNDIAKLIPRLSGPLLGSWARSTDLAILARAETAGLLDANGRFAIWEQTRAIRRASDFYPGTDWELLEVWATAFWNSTSSVQRGVIRALCKRIRESDVALLDPFLASRDGDAWRIRADSAMHAVLEIWSLALYPDELSSVHVEIGRAAWDAVQIVLNNDLLSSSVGELGNAASLATETLLLSVSEEGWQTPRDSYS